MIGYPFISELFTNILLKSNAIGGRFHLCPKAGNEINFDQLGEVLQDVVKKDPLKKYPLCLMMPPVSRGFFTDKAGEWESVRITLFFLKTSYYDSSNQVISRNLSTNTSTHTIPQDWHDMKRCATNFLFVLNKVQKDKMLINDKLRLDKSERIITPVSNIGIDRASGVRLDCFINLFNGCELEDYTLSELGDIEIPVNDSHPEHSL